MMNKKNKRISVCIGMLAMILCGCGREDGQVIPIGSQACGDGAVRNREVINTFDAGDLSGGSESLEGTANSDMSGNGWAEGEAEAGVGAEVADTILVHVCGAVKAPGVVELFEGSRVADALEAAGGFAINAAESSVNLADWVEDGQMLFFPTREEAESLAVREENAARGLVNINSAEVEELCTLPGIGESRALDIIAYREAYGAFTSCEEIMQVTGIKSGIYEKISDRITVR